MFSFRYTEFDWIFKCIIQSKPQEKDLTGGIVCNIIVVGVEAMNLRRIIEPWASQHLMFKQEAMMETKKGINFFFLFNGQNSVTKIKEKELRKKMFILVKWYRESSKIRTMSTEMCHMEHM